MPESFVSDPIYNKSQTVGIMATLYLIYLMHHQAVDYEMASPSLGQRRYNAHLHRKQPPIPRPRLLDLSKPKLERIPIYVPHEPVHTGRVMPPHDRRKHQRRLPSGRLIQVKACAIHGGGGAPKLTLVKLPAGAE